MLGILYLVLCLTVGWGICTFAFPNLYAVATETYDKKKLSLSPYLMLYPVWFLVGTLALTWSTYLLAIIFTNRQNPLILANAIVIALAILGSFLAAFFYIRNNNRINIDLYSNNKRVFYVELILLLGILSLAIILMWTTFFIKDNKLYVGLSVFSDFSPHIGMIRSFSHGNNFPTTYSHYAGEDIRYHFMFQFLVGNLEFLGMRLDYAFNIPSIMGFVSAFLMLYVLVLKMTGSIKVGILSCLFFAFRSSKSLFTYLAKLPKGTNYLEALKKNIEFIGDTPNENWGLWNLNVYCNQRHLAFGLTGMFFIIILFLPHIYDTFETFKTYHIERVELARNNGPEYNVITNFFAYVRFMFFTKEGWAITDWRLSIAGGIILGSLSFFHGSAVIACLLVLFMVAVLARRRLEFLVLAIITLILSLLQSNCFIEGSAIGMELLYGFIAENKSIFGVASYLGRLIGILPFIILASLCFEKGVHRYLMLAFSAPLIFALHVSLTVDVTVNHKYIMMSCILLGIFAANLVRKMLSSKDFVIKVVAILLIIGLTSTGIYDFTTVLRRNKPHRAIVLDMDDELTNWITQNSDSKDIFLSSNYALNQVVLGGAMLYQGWQYFAWSAGYNTEYRDVMVKAMYEAKTSTELDQYVKQNNISYIIVDHDNRVSGSYKLNEGNIKATYRCVYIEGEGNSEIAIYDTHDPIFSLDY